MLKEVVLVDSRLPIDLDLNPPPITTLDIEDLVDDVVRDLVPRFFGNLFGKPEKLADVDAADPPLHLLCLFLPLFLFCCLFSFSAETENLFTFLLETD